MDIVKVTPYIDRGLLRRRIEWVDGDDKGVADTNCAITGQPLGPNFTRCVHHCRQFGHYSREVCRQIELCVQFQEISEQEMLAFFVSHSVYPDSVYN